MTAQDYPVTFPYGATSAPYSAAHPHRGDDHPCPEGTPLVVGVVTIGLTGATGHVIGAHLHIQEWHGDYSNTRQPQNSFQPGTVTNIDPLGTQGDGSFGKFITIQTADGWNDTYCHLSEINVSVGQVIGGDMPTLVDDNINNDLAVGLLGVEAASNPYLVNHIGQPVADALREYIHYPQHQQIMNDAAEAPHLREQVATLQAQLDAISAAQTAPVSAAVPVTTITTPAPPVDVSTTTIIPAPVPVNPQPTSQPELPPKQKLSLKQLLHKWFIGKKG